MSVPQYGSFGARGGGGSTVAIGRAATAKVRRWAAIVDHIETILWHAFGLGCGRSDVCGLLVYSFKKHMACFGPLQGDGTEQNNAGREREEEPRDRFANALGRDA